MNKHSKTMDKITVMIVDDHTLVGEAWMLWLNTCAGFRIVGLCGSGEEAVDMAGATRPDIILMDINLPGMNGVEATEIIRRNYPSIKILAVSIHTHTSYVKKMMHYGASGYLTKNSNFDEMLIALKQVHEGKVYICKELKEAIVSQSFFKNQTETKLNQLSVREIEVIQYIKLGLYSKEIAEKLGITLKTVNAHRHNILKKLELKNTAALVQFINTHLINAENLPFVDRKNSEN